MPLQPGTRLGAYDVATQLGVGGMGEVWKARDTRLGRDVALKILPEAFASDPDRLARFKREAQVLASLNHPNIGAIYGLEESDGVQALVLELVDGPTLADRIAQGAIPVDEALPLAKQIAEALEAAHEAGVIHRDLKPANIKVREDGTVKVLDFGLAKALQLDATDASVTASPTISLTAAATQMGMVIGTAAYMAPEQAKGRAVDKRADVWAFGAVLYELLTGKRAFGGEDVSDTLASVLKIDPNWDELPSSAPARVRQIIRACLQRDPRQRIEGAQSVRLALEGAFDMAEAPAATSAVIAQPAWRRPLPVAVATGTAAVVLASLVAWTMWPVPDVPRVARLTVSPPDEQPFALGTNSPVVAISPNGQRVAYRVLVGGQSTLVVRALDSLEATVLVQGDSVGWAPFFSPDGAWIGFNDQNDDTIKRVAVTGGPAQTIARVGSGRLAGATWGADDTIIFGSNVPSGLWQVPASGGEPEPLTQLNEERGESNHEWPELLPGGEAVLFTIRHEAGTADTAEIAVRHLATGEQRVLMSGGAYPRYSPTGHIVYGFAGTLRAVPFDVDRLEVAGGPIGVVEGVRTRSSGAAEFALSPDGALVYLSGGAQRSSVVETPIYWMDASGDTTPLRATPTAWSFPAFSPDGNQLAVEMIGGQDDVWIADLARDTLSRLTLDPTSDRMPVWTPDGQRIAFGSLRSGSGWSLFWKRVDGTGEVQPLTESAPNQWPTSWHPTGEFLAFVEGLNQFDVMILPLAGDEATGWTPGEPTAFLNGPFDEEGAMFSPDGRWIAYHSNETGQDEVYVRPFPGPGGRIPISAGGGNHPLWSRSRPELFFSTLDQRIMVVPYSAEGDSFRAERPRLWAETRFADRRGIIARSFDLHPDGERFALTPLAEVEAARQEGDSPQLIVVLNWAEELKRLAPVN